ncbi:MAG: hypothetical protein QOH88_3441 [Verrucomicrobiota bacterium]|jgi:hypothetical protein
MTSAKGGLKPDHKVQKGKQNCGADEVSGRKRKNDILYTCWNDGAGNYPESVDDCSGYFICWKCGALNYPPR